MLSIAVMTHPLRMKYAEAIIDRIPNEYKPTLVVDEYTEGIWKNAMQAWRSYKNDCHYHMVLQDDILFCSDFFEALPEIIEAAYEINPNYSISFCDSIKKNTDICLQENIPWFTSYRVRHAQALVQPVNQIEDFIAYSERHVRPEFYHDDGRLEIYLIKHKKRILHTVPSLIEHDDWGSVTGMLNGKSPKNENSKRYQAYKFIGEDGKAGDINWRQIPAGFIESIGLIHQWAIGEINKWEEGRFASNPVFHFETSFLPYNVVMKEALKEREIYD